MPTFEELLEAIRLNNKTLTKVNLSGYDLTDEDVRKLVEALSSNTEVQSVSLSECGITDIGAQHLATLSRPKLTHLDLSGNDISDIGATALAANATFTDLWLSSNNIGDDGARALADNITLRVLELDSNHITDESAAIFSQNETLQMLRLGYNRITRFGVISLINSKIPKLVLDGNGPLDISLYDSIEENSTLTYLSLNKTGLTDADMSLFSKLSALTTLSINYNSITDEGVELFQRAGIPSNIKRLYIKGNNLSTRGVGITQSWEGIELLDTTKNHPPGEDLRSLSVGTISCKF